MKIPPRKKTIKVKGKSYEIEFPNTGGLIDIELLKMSLAKDQYGSLLDTNTSTSNWAMYSVDMIATLSILTPDLLKSMEVDSIRSLDVLDGKMLLKVYIKDILPWMREWDQVLNSDEEESEEKDK